MFKKLHIFQVSYEYEGFIREFFDTYSVECTKNYTDQYIIFGASMTDRVFTAFCDTILELGECGIYPIAC